MEARNYAETALSYKNFDSRKFSGSKTLVIFLKNLVNKFFKDSTVSEDYSIVSDKHYVISEN